MRSGWTFPPIGRSLWWGVSTDVSFDSTLPEHWTAPALHWRSQCRPSKIDLAWLSDKALNLPVIFKESASHRGDAPQLSMATEKADPQAAEALLPLVYQELRRLAAYKMAHEPPGQTLQPTALVHEVWIRLAAQENQTYANRTHFFAVAAEAMRRILIDRARRRRAVRHGGQAQRVDTDALAIAAPAPDDELLALDEALGRLAEREPQKAELVKLRYYVGLTLAEAAEVLGVSEPTAKRHWAYARAWLFRELEHPRKPTGDS